MSKLFLEAIRKLPDEFVHDDTRLVEHEGMVVAANPLFTPIQYRAGEWAKLTLMMFPDTRAPEGEARFRYMGKLVGRITSI